jgi:hypothetical protein
MIVLMPAMVTGPVKGGGEVGWDGTGQVLEWVTFANPGTEYTIARIAGR